MLCSLSERNVTFGKHIFRKTTDVISICLPQIFGFPILKKKITEKTHSLWKDNDEQQILKVTLQAREFP